MGKKKKFRGQKFTVQVIKRFRLPYKLYPVVFIKQKIKIKQKTNTKNRKKQQEIKKKTTKYKKKYKNKQKKIWKKQKNGWGGIPRKNNLEF